MKFNNYFMALPLTLCLLFAVGCEQRDQSKASEESMLKASFMLDQRDYDGAIAKFEEITQADPSNEVAKIKLFHAYAGAGGFEALTLMDVLKAAEDKLTEIKEREKIKIEIKVKEKEIEGIDNALAQLEQVLAKVPTLNAAQKTNLNKALSLYEQLGLKLETAGKYNNFKWGTLHAFRLAVNLKEVVVGLKNSKDESQNYNLKAVEKVVLSHSKELGTDFFQVIKLYSHSYDKFKLIREKVENLVGKTLGNKEFKMKINDLAGSEVEFYESFIRENSKAVTQIINKYIESSKGAVDQLLSHSDEILPSKSDMSDTRMRLQALITLSVRQFTIEKPESEIALKELFSAETKQELYRALIDSIKAEDMSPLKTFLLSQDGKFKAVATYAKLLLNEMNEDGVADEVKNELNALKAKVNEELLKQELENTKQALQLAEESAQQQATLLNENDKVMLENHLANLKERLQEIEEYLKSPVEELSNALSSKVADEDQIQIDRILKSVFNKKW